jgi:hypothetical protein
MQLDGEIDSATLARLLPTPNAILASFVGAIHLAIDAMISPSRIELRRAEISTENAEWELRRLLK